MLPPQLPLSAMLASCQNDHNPISRRHLLSQSSYLWQPRSRPLTLSRRHCSFKCNSSFYYSNRSCNNSSSNNSNRVSSSLSQFSLSLLCLGR